MRKTGGIKRRGGWVGVQVRVTNAEKKALEWAATDTGQSVSTWARGILRETLAAFMDAAAFRYQETTAGASPQEAK